MTELTLDRLGHTHTYRHERTYGLTEMLLPRFSSTLREEGEGKIGGALLSLSLSLVWPALLTD